MSPNQNEMDAVTEEDDIFETIMAQVGLKGRFQKRFNYIFNLIFILLVALPYMNIVLAMAVPEHWCFVPGRENHTLEEWKELTIPRHGEEGKYEQCKMYKPHVSNSTAIKPELTGAALEVIDCAFGWEFDQTWYYMTIPSYESWVCDQDMKVTTTFTIGRIADVIGTFTLGQLADVIGRKPVFIIVLLLLVIGRIGSIFVTHIFPMFLVATVLANLAVSSVFQSPLVISMEVSDSDKRAHIAMLQCLGWTSGICILPLIAWAAGDWYIMMLITTLPIVAYFFLLGEIPESPRWLAAKGKPEECIKSLTYISKINGTTLHQDARKKLEYLALHREKTYGLASLFSSWQIFKFTIILVCSMIINSFAYYVLVLNVTNMAGNPFMNFFWQSLVEFPGCIVGRLLSDRYGRRWTQSGMFLAVAVVCVAITGIVRDPSMTLFCAIMVVTVKFIITVTYYVVYLQAMELYPTCVRQTGTSFGVVVANALGVFGPYVVYLGQTVDVRYPYICLGIMGLVGCVTTAFLPETLHQKLPETLLDAQNFGEDQNFWTFKDYIKAEKNKNKKECFLEGLNEGLKNGIN